MHPFQVNGDPFDPAVPSSPIDRMQMHPMVFVNQCHVGPTWISPGWDFDTDIGIPWDIAELAEMQCQLAQIDAIDATGIEPTYRKQAS